MPQAMVGTLPAVEALSYRDGDPGQDQHDHKQAMPGQSLSLTSVMPTGSITSQVLQVTSLPTSSSPCPARLPSGSSTSTLQGFDPYTRHGKEMPAGPVSAQCLPVARSPSPPPEYQDGNTDVRRGSSADVNGSNSTDIHLRENGTILVDGTTWRAFPSTAQLTDETLRGFTPLATPAGLHLDRREWEPVTDVTHAAMVQRVIRPVRVNQWCGGTYTTVPNLDRLPNEILMHIFSCLDVSDLLTTSRINHHLRSISLLPILHHHRLERARFSLPALLASPSRPSLSELIARHIFLTHTTQVSRKLARSLVAIRLSRRLPLRPSAEALVQRGVLPGECVEGLVAPGLVATKRAVERERLKDGLRSWVGAVWRGKVWERGDLVRRWEESRGVGRVWKLRQYWERVAKNSNTGCSVA